MGWLRRLSPFGKKRSSRSTTDLPWVERDRIGHLLSTEHSFPHVDWGAAEIWCEREGVSLRAVGAAWLDEVRDAMSGEYRRWRHSGIEGLAASDVAMQASKTGDRALRVVSASLSRALGNVQAEPVGIVVFDGHENYLSFTSHYYPEEGEWATSGGCYLNEGGRECGALPLIVTHAGAKWSLEMTIAHEMTHHLLHGRGLPLWVEEGFTQMMEERVTGYTGFRLDGELLSRHRERWMETGLEFFLTGDAFSSGREDDQELAYHLAQWIARAELSERPDSYFRFVRDCDELGPEESAAQHLGASLEELVAARVGLG